MSIINYEDKKPKVHASVFLPPDSIGEVTIDEGSGPRRWSKETTTLEIGARVTARAREAPVGSPGKIGVGAALADRGYCP